MNRTNIIVAIILLLALAACGRDNASTLSSGAPEYQQFHLAAATQGYVDPNDAKAPVVEFGDPSLGQAVTSRPPAQINIGVLHAKPASAPASKGVSCASKCDKGHEQERCDKDHGDKDNHQAECNKDKDKKDCDKDKHQTECDKDKDKKDCDKDKGGDCDNDKSKPCDTPPPPCHPKVVGICNYTNILWQTADGCASGADVTYIAQVQFDGNGGQDGTEVIFKLDGTEVGRANTDSTGKATFTGTSVPRGPHTVTECVADGSGATTATKSSSCATCGSPDGCTSCVTTSASGYFCSSLRIAVYTTFIHGAVTGQGEVKTCDPNNALGSDAMEFRVAYDNGQVQGWLTYEDGPSNSGTGRWFKKVPVTWAVMAGNEAWFGNSDLSSGATAGAWVVHVVDGGPLFTQDYFEIQFLDPCRPYCCGGFLVGCYVKTSYRYTSQCP